MYFILFIDVIALHNIFMSTKYLCIILSIVDQICSSYRERFCVLQALNTCQISSRTFMLVKKAHEVRYQSHGLHVVLPPSSINLELMPPLEIEINSHLHKLYLISPICPTGYSHWHFHSMPRCIQATVSVGTSFYFPWEVPHSWLKIQRQICRDHHTPKHILLRLQTVFTVEYSPAVVSQSKDSSHQKLHDGYWYNATLAICCVNCPSFPFRCQVSNWVSRGVLFLK